MAVNTTLTADLILKEAQRLFKNKTPFLQGMYRDYDGTMVAGGSKAGESIRIRKPMKYSFRSGKTAQVQANNENSVTLSKSTQGGVDLTFSSAELSQDINRFSELYLEPAMNAITSGIEVDIFEQAVQQTYNQVGTLGTDPASFKVFTDAGAKMTNFSTPGGVRSMIINPNGMSSAVDALKGLFQSESNIRSQYLEAQIRTGMGLEFAETVNVGSHTNGTSNGNYVIDGAAQTGASILLKTGSGTFTKGDVITFVGVNAVNPITFTDMGELQQFVVTADYSSGSVSVSPSIVTSGNQKTVTASPADGAAVSESAGFVAGASNAINLAYHKLAFAFGTVDLEMPGNSDFEARSVVDKVSMRLVKWYDGKNDDQLYRIDVLYGFVAVTPEWACRVAGA